MANGMLYGFPGPDLANLASETPLSTGEQTTLSTAGIGGEFRLGVWQISRLCGFFYKHDYSAGSGRCQGCMFFNNRLNSTRPRSFLNNF